MPAQWQPGISPRKHQYDTQNLSVIRSMTSTLFGKAISDATSTVIRKSFESIVTSPVVFAPGTFPQV